MSAVSASNGKEQVVYVGTYTEPQQSTSEGVYVYGLDPVTGNLAFKAVIRDLVNPSFLAVHPQTGFLYAVHEKGTFEGRPGGGVIALAFHPGTGESRLLNKQTSFEAMYTILNDFSVEAKYNVYNYDDYLVLNRYYTANVVWINVAYNFDFQSE